MIYQSIRDRKLSESGKLRQTNKVLFNLYYLDVRIICISFKTLSWKIDKIKTWKYIKNEIKTIN